MKLGIDQSKRWFVVQTNIKSERKAEDNLRLAGFDVYLPTYRVEIKNKRTNTYITRERPLLMRYMFVGMDMRAQHFGFVRACEGVESLLGVNGTPIPVPARDIEALYLAEFDMRFDDTRAARIHRKEEAATRKQTLEMKYAKGNAVTVTAGPFASFGGLVDEVTKKGNVRVIMSLFGSLVPAEFEAAHLEVA